MTVRRVQQDSGRKLETWLGQKTNGMVTQCDTFTGVPPKLVPLSESWLEWNYDDLTASPAESNELMVVKKYGSYPRAYVRMRKTTKAQSEIANAAARRGHRFGCPHAPDCALFTFALAGRGAR